jgi:hypothetical protein
MDLETVALLAEIRFKILEAAIMVKNDFTKEEILNQLVETAESINNAHQITKE